MISDVLAEAKDKMSKAIEVAKDDFATVRTGRANPLLFQKILVDYYGTPTPLGQLASMQNPEARMLVVTAREPDSGDAGRLSRVALAFTLKAQLRDGRTRNRMNAFGQWVDEPATDDWRRAVETLIDQAHPAGS